MRKWGDQGGHGKTGTALRPLPGPTAARPWALGLPSSGPYVYVTAYRPLGRVGRFGLRPQRYTCARGTDWRPPSLDLGTGWFQVLALTLSGPPLPLATTSNASGDLAGLAGAGLP